MISIQPIKAFSDNYIWAMVNEDSKQAIVVDPGQAEPVIDFIHQHDLALQAIWITHEHPDHIGGVQTLIHTFSDVEVVAHHQHGVSPQMAVDDASILSAWQHQVRIWKVAGHTHNHLAYLVNIDGVEHVFCGDTLFSGGCGRVFTGDMQAMSESLQRLATLTDTSLFYPAHEYTASNLTFGLFIEPENMAMSSRLAEVKALTTDGRPSLPSSLAQERQMNVFMRVAEPSVIDKLKNEHGLQKTDAVSVFTLLRQLKDNF